MEIFCSFCHVVMEPSQADLMLQLHLASMVVNLLQTLLCSVGREVLLQTADQAISSRSATPPFPFLSAAVRQLESIQPLI